jgi:hypothetical protein
VIRSIAVVPHPPLLVPELMGAAWAELEPLRTACQQAVRRLGVTRWYAVGADTTGPMTMTAGATGSFRGYGVDVPVTLGAAGPDRTPRAATDGLALPLLAAGWLAGQVDVTPTVVGELLHPATPPGDCLEHGRHLAAALDGDWSLLVLADGAHTHDVPGAGRVDERAGDHDARVAEALGTADTVALAALDVTVCGELGVSGRVPWQVLAGAAGGRDWAAELLYTGAPYGVGYHVAVWEAP